MGQGKIYEAISFQRENDELKGWADNTMGEVFSLHVTDPDSIPAARYGTPSTVRSDP